MMLNNKKNLPFFMSLLLVTACAPKQTGVVTDNSTSLAATSSAQLTDGSVNSASNEVIPVAKREAQTAAVSSWELSGAMAARGKNKSWSASLNWQQRGANNYQMRLSGPLGSGTVIIAKSGGKVTYRDGPKTVSSGNADSLLMQQTGVRLPVNNLYYWVRGLPAPGGVQSEKRDQYNHLSELRQSGYVIHYGGYTSVKGKDLPSRINLQGNGVVIKLVVKQWRI